MKELSRRSFLKGALAGSAAMALGAVAGLPGLEYTRSVSRCRLMRGKISDYKSGAD